MPAPNLKVSVLSAVPLSLFGLGIGLTYLRVLTPQQAAPLAGACVGLAFLSGMICIPWAARELVRNWSELASWSRILGVLAVLGFVAFIGTTFWMMFSYAGRPGTGG